MRDVTYLMFDDVGVHIVSPRKAIKPLSQQSTFKFQFVIDGQRLPLKIHSEKLDSQFELIICRIYEIQLSKGATALSEITKNLNQDNPLGFDFKYGHPYYELKLKEFLSLLLLKYSNETLDPIIICDNNLFTICCYVYNRISFLSYIFKNAQINLVRINIKESERYLLNISISFSSLTNSSNGKYQV